MPTKISDKDFPDHFWSRVEVGADNDCWNWTGATWQGYGILHRRGKNKSAHRVAYQLANGAIPDGLLVCHSCDNPKCCNPKHLFLGTNQDNSDDKFRKGRFVPSLGDNNGSRTHPESRPRGDFHWTKLRPDETLKGEANGRSKLTQAQVQEIRDKRSNGFSYLQLAREFGVGESTIAKIMAIIYLTQQG